MIGEYSVMKIKIVTNVTRWGHFVARWGHFVARWGHFVTVIF